MDDFFPVRLKLRNRRSTPIENIADCMSDRHGKSEAFLFFLDKIETDGRISIAEFSRPILN